MKENNELENNPLKMPSVIDQSVKFEVQQKDYFRPKFAGFWIRFWAYTIDLIVLSAISGIIIKPIFRVADIAISKPWFLLFSPYKITTLILLLLYFTLMTKFFQQTIGKMIIGIKVIPKEGDQLTWSTVIFREVFGRFISTLLLIPYFLVIFMPKKEGLHDLFADTFVTHEDTYEKEIQVNHVKRSDGQQLQEGPIV